MAEDYRVVTPYKFCDALQAAGLLPEAERISEVVIRARPNSMVTIEVTYFADERIFQLAAPDD